MSEGKKIFSDDVLEILKNNPASAKYINDAKFMDICQEIFQNPNNILKYQQDPDLQAALRTILPILTNPNIKSNNFNTFINGDPEEEKKIGNDFFAKGDFRAALSHYDNAIKLNPNNIIYYTNRATALTKLQNYSDASEACLRGIDAGIKNGASKSQIAKAYSKLGNSEKLAGNNDAAIFAFEKSLEYQNDSYIRSVIDSLKSH